MAIPHTLGNSMRAHDKAVYDWIGTLLVDYNTIAGVARNGFPILRTFASPQRAFATVTDMLVAQDFLDGATAADMRQVGDEAWPKLPLPIVTIEREEPQVDAEQANVVGVFRRAYLNPVTGLWEYHRHPGHFLTAYRVTFRMEKRYTEQYIREWLYSQLGKVGCAHNELLLTVVHDAPWGAQPHRLRFDGSQDLSVLEGDESRMLVYEFTFTLRTWIFYPALPGAPIIHGTGIDPMLITEGYAITDDQGAAVGASPVEAVSANLWTVGMLPSDFPTRWPKTGAAAVSVPAMSPSGRPDHRRGFRAKVDTLADSVEIAERLCRPDSTGRSILSLSFRYLARGAGANLVGSRHDVAVSGAITPVYSLDLPLARHWENVHVFTVVDKPAFVWALAGQGAASDITIADPDIRQVYDGPRTVPGSTSVVGAERVYQWTGLDKEPYLLVGILTTGGSGIVTVTAKDSAYAPSYQPTEDVDRGMSVGFAILVQPTDGTLALHVPVALGLDTVYALRYHGHYDGHSL